MDPELAVNYELTGNRNVAVLWIVKCFQVLPRLSSLAGCEQALNSVTATSSTTGYAKLHYARLRYNGTVCVSALR